VKRKPPEIEAAIMAALLAGQGVTEVARTFNVSHATVSRLRARLSGEALDDIKQDKRDDIADLLYSYLRETLVTLSVQTRFFRNEVWLKQQSAADLALLHGIAFDKAIRLLEAIERAHEVWGEATTEVAGDDAG
jgi:hypothetical protein